MKTIDINQLREDDMNFNRGTYYGAEMIQTSFDEFGAGRSILVDKDNNIIAGNKSTRAAKNSGIRNARVVDSDGSRLVVVKRTDISLDSRKGREMPMQRVAVEASIGRMKFFFISVIGVYVCCLFNLYN